MPRAPRYQDAGYVHHVICRGNDRQILFKSPKDFRVYLDLLKEARRLYPLHVYNYVLMDNHIHLLVEPLQEGSLSKVMEHVSKHYAKYFNATYGHVGHVFQGRFKSFLIEETRYYFACSRYIDINPLKAGMVRMPQDYRWSGFAKLAHGKEGEFKLDLHELYQELGRTEQERQIGYRAIVLNYQGEELDLLNQRQGILGESDFKSKIQIRA
jgi:putative transposase